MPEGQPGAITVKQAVLSLACTGQGLLTSSPSCLSARCDVVKSLSMEEAAGEVGSACCVHGGGVGCSAHGCVKNMVMCLVSDP